jgi:AcrR family transcriptional regulator
MSRDPRPTKARLLAAAREEFAAYGVAGARVDRIAALAVVNKERIYAYFGNKENLFNAVVTDALDELVDAVQVTSAEDSTEYVGRVYDFHRDNPAVFRLFLWEALYYSEHPLPNEAGRTARYRKQVTDLAESLDTDPSHETAAALLTLIGLAAWPTGVPPLASLIVGASTGPRAVRHTMRDHIIEFVRRAWPDSSLTIPAAAGTAPSPRPGSAGEEPGPPPVRKGLENQTGEDDDGQPPFDECDAAFGEQRVVQRRSGAKFTAGQPEHHPTVVIPFEVIPPGLGPGW